MASSSANENDVENLELEVHYLSQALTKLKRRTPEWSFLNQKLEAAEDELEATRSAAGPAGNGGYRDDPGASGPATGYSDAAVPTPSPSARTNVVWTSEGGYRDQPDNRNDGDVDYNDNVGSYDHDDRDGGSDRRPLFDDASFEPVNTSASSAGVHARRKFSRILAPGGGASATDDDGGGYAKQGKPRGRQYLVYSAVALLVALSCVVFLVVTLKDNGGDGSVKVANQHESVQEITEPCASFSMHLIPDKFGNETSWEVVRFEDGAGSSGPPKQWGGQVEVVLAGGPYSYKKGFDSDAIGAGSHYEMVHATTCLPVGQYGFILYDARGDGICCDYGRGEYGINLSKGRVIRPLSPGSFRGESQVTTFEVAEEDIDVVPVAGEVGGEVGPIVDEVGIEETPEGPCASFSMHLIPDQFGNETSWKVRRYDGVKMSDIIETHQFQKGTVVLEGGPYLYRPEFDREAIGSHYEMVHATTCLPVGSYTFILYDAKGDGICCNYGRGEYGINLSKGRVIRPLSSGKFSGAGEVTPFEVATADIDVLPSLPSPSSMEGADTKDPLEGSVAEDISGDHAGAEGPLEGSLNGPPDAPPPVPSAGSGEEPCASFAMHLVPDQFGNETSWKVLQKAEGSERRYNKRYLRALAATYPPRGAQMQAQPWTVVLAGGPYSYRKGFDGEAGDVGGTHYNAIVARTCLPVGSYKFILYDARGDGICCFYGRGEYGINLSRGRVVRPLSAGEFSGVDEVTPFEVTEADIDVHPVSRPSTGAAPNDTPDWSSPSSSSFTSTSDPNSAPDTTVDMNDPLHDWQSSVVTNGPPATSVNSLTSLVTVSADGSTNGRGKSYGILFDVETSPSASPLVIAGMELYLDTNVETHYEIWTKVGSWQDVNEANPDFKHGFHQVSHGSITGQGSHDFTKIALSDFQDVELPPGRRQAFYVTLSDNKLVFKNYDEDGLGRHEMGSAVQAGKDEFKVYYGAAVRAYPLEVADPVTDLWNNAGFLGRLWYKKRDR